MLEGEQACGLLLQDAWPGELVAEASHEQLARHLSLLLLEAVEEA